MQEYINKECEKLKRKLSDRLFMPQKMANGELKVIEYQDILDDFRTSLTNLVKYQAEEIEKRIETQKKITNRFVAKDIETAEIMDTYYRNGLNKALSEVRGIIKLT